MTAVAVRTPVRKQVAMAGPVGAGGWRQRIAAFATELGGEQLDDRHGGEAGEHSNLFALSIRRD